MKYSSGDIVQFKLESGEIQEGNVLFIDMTHNTMQNQMTLLLDIRKRRNDMRGRLDIIIDILEIAKKEVNKTKIVYGANLNFQLTEKYLVFLVEKGFMDNRQDKYITTDKGKMILEKAKEINIQLK